MLRHGSADPAFWEALQQRAEQLGLARTLHHGLQQTHGLLGTPVPEAARQSAARHAAPEPVDALMQQLWRSALRTPHSSARLALTPAAEFLLFVRAHALRMPPGMLLKHLGTKAWRRHVLREEGA
jgi:hypothetical protein